MGEIIFEEWSESPKIKTYFDGDFEKIKSIKEMSFFLLFLYGLFILSLLGLPFLSKWIELPPKLFLIIPAFLIFLVIGIIKQNKNYKRKLSNKDFIVLLLKKISGEIKLITKNKVVGENEVKENIKLLKNFLKKEIFDKDSFNYDGVIKLKNELYNLISHIEFKINKNEINNENDSLFLSEIAKDIWNETTPNKIVNSIIQKHKNEFEIEDVKRIRIKKRYLYVGIIFISVLLAEIFFKMGKEFIFSSILVFIISIVFAEILKN